MAQDHGAGLVVDGSAAAGSSFAVLAGLVPGSRVTNYAGVFSRVSPEAYLPLSAREHVRRLHDLFRPLVTAVMPVTFVRGGRTDLRALSAQRLWAGAFICAGFARQSFCEGVRA
ncbi:hypothetical protein [Salinisphaera sp. S4-8]|uniref:hypothetical protein n=1 Tax=Salinisphaera sp. S4-8 TaxID=633357 RepID=UPI00333E8E1E